MRIDSLGVSDAFPWRIDFDMLIASLDLKLWVLLWVTSQVMNLLITLILQMWNLFHTGRILKMITRASDKSVNLWGKNWVHYVCNVFRK